MVFIIAKVRNFFAAFLGLLGPRPRRPRVMAEESFPGALGTTGV